MNEANTPLLVEKKQVSKKELLSFVEDCITVVVIGQRPDKSMELRTFNVEDEAERYMLVQATADDLLKHH